MSLQWSVFNGTVMHLCFMFIDALVFYVHLIFFIIFILRLNRHSHQTITLSQLESLLKEKVC